MDIWPVAWWCYQTDGTVENLCGYDSGINIEGLASDQRHTAYAESSMSVVQKSRAGTSRLG